MKKSWSLSPGSWQLSKKNEKYPIVFKIEINKNKINLKEVQINGYGSSEKKGISYIGNKWFSDAWLELSNPKNVV